MPILYCRFRHRAEQTKSARSPRELTGKVGNMTFYRIFSAVTKDTGCDWYDETENHKMMMDDIAHLVNIGSCFSVRVYSSRHDFMCGANPYAVLDYAGNGVIDVLSVFPGKSPQIHVESATPAVIAERVGARVRTLERRYASVY